MPAIDSTAFIWIAPSRIRFFRSTALPSSSSCCSSLFKKESFKQCLKITLNQYVMKCRVYANLKNVLQDFIYHTVSKEIINSHAVLGNGLLLRFMQTYAKKFRERCKLSFFLMQSIKPNLYVCNTFPISLPEEIIIYQHHHHRYSYKRETKTLKYYLSWEAWI